ncbi:MAG: hypothetical protein AAGI07_20380 [Bacteroidota bacterium]
MKRIVKYILVLVVSGLMFAACEDESDMAIERIASPVLVEVGSLETTDTDFSISATIYELDKSGILDQSVGIDSLPVPGVLITVTTVTSSNVRTKLEDLTTDSDGKVLLNSPSENLFDVVSLEWSGEFKGQSFTKIFKL